MAQRHDPLSNRELLILIIEGIEIMSQNSDAINKAASDISAAATAITNAIPELNAKVGGDPDIAPAISALQSATTALDGAVTALATVAAPAAPAAG